MTALKPLCTGSFRYVNSLRTINIHVLYLKIYSNTDFTDETDYFKVTQISQISQIFMLRIMIRNNHEFNELN